MPLYGGITLPGRPDLDNIRRLDLMILPALNRYSRVGVSIDIPYLEELSLEFGHEMAELQKEISSYIPPYALDQFSAAAALVEEEEGSATINAASAEQIGVLLFDLLKIGRDKKLKSTSTGKISTGRKNLEFIREQHPVVPLILQYRERQKLKSAFCDSLPGKAVRHPRAAVCPVCELAHAQETWRLHTTFTTTRAITGRLSSKAPNLQQIPIRSEIGSRIRGAFLASPGCRLVSVDFSQMEIRDLAHLANARSMISVYEADGDIHMKTAMQTFKIDDPAKVDKYKHRLPSKRCLAGGQKVLTNHGRIAIEQVTCHDLVWDGCEFVQHDGVVSNGIQPVICCDGLWLTPDHKVFTNDGRKLSGSKAHRQGIGLSVTGSENGPLKYAFDHFRETGKKRFRLPLCHRALSSVRIRAFRADRQHTKGKHHAVSLHEERQAHGPQIEGALREIHSDPAAVRESAQRELQELRRSRDSEQIQKLSRIRRLHSAASSPQGLQRCRYWPEGQRRTLRAGELGARNKIRQFTEHQTQPVCLVRQRKNNSGGTVQASEKRLSRFQAESEACDEAGRARSPLARDTSSETARTLYAPVYDILNAGPRHRFTIENKLVANCNFGIQNGTTEKGLHAQLVTDYWAAGITPSDWLTPEWCKGFIESWHSAYPEVQPYFEEQYHRARRYGFVWDPWGRTRYIPQVRSSLPWKVHEGFRETQNFPVTASNAEQTKLAMAECEEEFARIRSCGVYCEGLLSIHDQVIAEVEEEYAEYVGDLMVRVFESVMDDRETGERLWRTPIKSDCEILERWKSKE